MLGPTKESSKKQYERYQALFEDWMTTNEKEFNEDNLCLFFTAIQKTHPGSIYSIHSMVNALAQSKYRIDTGDFLKSGVKFDF